jgi:hypothetical protein
MESETEKIIHDVIEAGRRKRKWRWCSSKVFMWFLQPHSKM